MLLMLKQLKLLSNPFRTKLLLLLLDVEEEVAVVEELSQGVFVLDESLEMGISTWIYVTLIARDV